MSIQRGTRADVYSNARVKVYPSMDVFQASNAPIFRAPGWEACERAYDVPSKGKGKDKERSEESAMYRARAAVGDIAKCNRFTHFFTMVMALALVLSLAVPAFAYGPGEEETLDVKAKYDSTTSTPTIYSVDIDWDSLTFTYTEKNTKTWKPSNHSYTTSSDGKWDKTTANITVTNHSNAAVTVAMAYTATTTDSGVTATLTGGSKTLAAGKENMASSADSVTGTVTISGKPNSSVTASGITVGSVTITINK